MPKKKLYFLSRKYVPYWLIFPAIIVIVAIMLYPLVYSIYISFLDMKLGREAIPFVGLRNYAEAMFSKVFRKVLTNNLIFMAIAVPAELIFGFVIAILLNRSFKGRRVVRVLFLLPMLAAPVVAGTNFRWLLNEQFGLINAILRVFNLPTVAWLVSPPWPFASILFAEIWQYTPFAMILLLAGLQSLPDALFEAAQIDGANKWQQTRHIAIPLLTPIISIIVILRIVDIFRIFDVVYVMTQGGPARTTDLLPTYTYEMAFTQVRFGYAGAISWMTLVISLIFIVPLIRSAIMRSFD